MTSLFIFWLILKTVEGRNLPVKALRAHLRSCGTLRGVTLEIQPPPCRRSAAGLAAAFRDHPERSTPTRRPVPGRRTLVPVAAGATRRRDWAGRWAVAPRAYMY